MDNNIICRVHSFHLEISRNSACPPIPTNSCHATSANNTYWISLGTFAQQPDAGGVATINLPGPMTTWGIQIIPVAIGQDNVGNYVFQLNEIELLR